MWKCQGFMQASRILSCRNIVSGPRMMYFDILVGWILYWDVRMYFDSWVLLWIVIMRL